MIKTTLNNPASEEFIENIGKFIANFGVVELTIIEMSDALSQDPILTKLAHRAMLNRRVEILKDQIEAANLEAEFQGSILNTLNILKLLIEFRNIIAHNPITFSFHEDDPSNAALVSGILNMRPKNKKINAELVSSEELAGRVNESVAIAKKLREDLTELIKMKKMPNHPINADGK